jgi:hypothetical protein
LTTGDLAGIIAALAPRPVRLESCVDALNRPMPASEAEAALLPARNAYQRLDARRRLEIYDAKSSPAETVQWLLDALRGAER